MDGTLYEKMPTKVKNRFFAAPLIYMI